MLTAREILQNCQVEVWPATYAVAKAKVIPQKYVAVFQDRKEITVVAEEKELGDDWVMEAEPGWRMLSFRATLPFELVGFLAVISQALAEAQVSIFALSAYSTDHLLIRQSDLSKAIDVLQSLGCAVKEVS